MARISLSGILGQLRKIVKNADKVAWLQKHQSKPLFYVLWLGLAGTQKWLLPEGAPPFRPYVGRPGSEPSDLLRELRKLYLFLDGTGNHISQLKREKMFQEALQDLSAEHVELLLALKDGTFEKSFRCPRKVVEEAFPGLFDAPFTNKFA